MRIARMFVVGVMMSVLFISVSGRMAEAETYCWNNMGFNAIDMTCKGCRSDRDYRVEIIFDSFGRIDLFPANFSDCHIVRTIAANEEENMFLVTTWIISKVKPVRIKISIQLICCIGCHPVFATGSVEVWKGKKKKADPIVEICNLKWFNNMWNDPTVPFGITLREILNSTN